jgi:hypothetical protein
MGTIRIDQKKYIKSGIAKFGMADAKQRLTPMEANFKLKHVPKDLPCKMCSEVSERHN